MKQSNKKRTSNTSHGNRRYKSNMKMKLGLGLEGVEPIGQSNHFDLLNNILNNDSIQKIVFSDGSLNTEYLRKT